jgi:hypothetical protein
MIDLAGQHIDQCQILDEHGQGGMATVFKETPVGGGYTT